MKFRILLGRHLLNAGEGVDHAEDENGGADIEAPDHRRRDNSFRGGICKADPGEEDGEKVSHKGSGIAKEALDGVGLGFLLLVHHISHHHLEGLHCDVDAGIKENEGEKAEPHGHVKAQEQACREVE